MGNSKLNFSLTEWLKIDIEYSRQNVHCRDFSFYSAGPCNEPYKLMILWGF